MVSNIKLSLIVLRSGFDEKTLSLFENNKKCVVCIIDSMEDIEQVARQNGCHALLIHYSFFKEKKDCDIFKKNMKFGDCFILDEYRSIPISFIESAQESGIYFINVKDQIDPVLEKISNIVFKFRAGFLTIRPLEESENNIVNNGETLWIINHLLSSYTNLYIDEDIKEKKFPLRIKGHVDSKIGTVYIKIGEAVRIHKEWENYHRFILSNLRSTQHVYLEQHFLWWNKGGLRMTFLDVQRGFGIFHDYYQLRETHDIEKILSSLFKDILLPLYKSEQKTMQISLFDAYNDYLFKGSLSTTWGQADHEIMHICEWVKRNKSKSNLRGQGVDVRVCPTHGDLWGDNILVEVKENQDKLQKKEFVHCWIIDFERTGLGHSLRDFIELEIDILTRMSEIQIDNNIFLKLAVAINNPKELSKEFPKTINGILDNDKISKAFEVIQALRRIAYDFVGGIDMREYYWGLLMDSLFVLTNINLDNTRKQRVIILANVICTRLEHWDKNDDTWIGKIQDSGLSIPISWQKLIEENDDSSSSSKKSVRI